MGGGVFNSENEKKSRFAQYYGTVRVHSSGGVRLRQAETAHIREGQGVITAPSYHISHQVFLSLGMRDLRTPDSKTMPLCPLQTQKTNTTQESALFPRSLFSRGEARA